MKEKRLVLKILNIIPAQHYLCREKLERVKKEFKLYSSYGDIFVIEYNGLFFSIDGHHRLFLLYQKGVREVEVINEFSDNDSVLYKSLAHESLALGLQNISSLGDRFIETFDEYKREWIDKCQTILSSNK